MGHVPKYGKGKQKTNREEHSQNAPPERPDKSLRTRHGSKFSGTATMTGQRRSRCGRSQEHRYILPAPATERPRTSENTPVRGSNGCVRCARKSDPMNDRATTYEHHNGKMAVQTDEEARRGEPMTGATAIPRVKYGGENHCASPITIGAFTLPKQCNRPPIMKWRGQLGCPPGTCPIALTDKGPDPLPEYSASSRMPRERTDWRPTCRKSTCRPGVGLEAAPERR